MITFSKIWYNLTDADLHDMLGLKPGKDHLDERTVIKRLKDGGVKIHSFGRQRVVKAEDLYRALDKQESETYTPKGKLRL